MADFGLAAQIGRGNAMPGAQQQDPQNRMMQMMQLQQLQQNMMLAREQEGRAAGLYGTQLGTLQEQLNNLRKTEERAAGLFGPEFERKKYDAETAGSQSIVAKVAANTAQEGYNVKTRLLKMRAGTEPDVMMSPEFQKNLMSKDPELAVELGRLVTEGQKKNSELTKAGYDETTARMAQQKAIVGSIANSLGGVVDQQTFTTVLNELEKVDPLATKLIGPRFTAEAMIKLERRMRGLQNFEIKEDAKGNFVRINLDDNTSATVGSRVLPDVKLNPEGDAATFDAARTLGAAPPPGASPGAPYTPPGEGPKAAAAAEKKAAELRATETATDAARRKGAAEVIKALSNPEIEKLISRSTSGVIERGLGLIPRAFGKSTSGMEAIGQLDTIAGDVTLRLLNGKLGAGISNADVKLIEKTLADIGNTFKPADERLAAFKQLKKNLEAIVSGQSIEVVPGSQDPKKDGAVDTANPYLRDMPFGTGRR
jgi:hypothetical protein